MFKQNIAMGDTPMIRIKYRYINVENYIYAKLEYYNVTGSIKDRVAYYIINNAKKRGALKENMRIVEATSGNTGIALAALGTYYNHPVDIFMPDWVSKERIELMKNYGAKVHLVSKEEGGFLKAIADAERLAKETGSFLANQFKSKDNILAHYETTGEEILKQVPEKIGGFVSGVGTGGTLMGTSKRLKEEYSNMLTVAIEPDKMALLSGGNTFGSHKIEGIGDDFIPEIVDIDKIDKVIVVNDEDAINMSRKLSRKLGIGVGISSGANFLGSVQLSENIDGKVVTIFADDNKKYLTTDLSKEIDNNSKYISNKIELLGYEIV